MAIYSRPLLLLRHGQTTWNAERRWQGWADAPLSELGEQQSRDAARHLGNAAFTVVCSSDLQRARRTAEFLAAGLGVENEVVLEPALRERNVGVFSGKTIDEILAEYPDCFEAETRRLIRVPEGESDDDLWDRVVPGLVSLVDRFAGETLLVVSHGGVLRTIERRLGGNPGQSMPNLGGRWLKVAGDELVLGERFVPIEAQLVTTPTTE